MGKYLRSESRGATTSAFLIWLTVIFVNLFFWQHVGSLFSSDFAWLEQKAIAQIYTPTSTPTETPTQTPTETPSATPTDTRFPDGAGCTDPIDCDTGNCVDDVCCDAACAGPNQACNTQGSVGSCVDTAAAAPTTSRAGLLIGLGILFAIGAIAFGRRRGLTN